jgi:hypothetical protein
VRRLGKLEVGFWLETSGDFLRAKSFQIFAFRFSIQFSQSKSTIKIRNKNPQRISRILILSKQNFAQKKKEMSWSKWEF